MIIDMQVVNNMQYLIDVDVNDLRLALSFHNKRSYCDDNKYNPY